MMQRSKSTASGALQGKHSEMGQLRNAFRAFALEGETYAVQLAVSDTYLGEDHTVVWTSHVTVRDGVVYWYPAIC